ncbi:MAG: homocysteine S-methyltransferase family protein [Sedimentisphaerales bacterium]|nr:homocysteine S-methyltransferase family protein [Sedimentisphaerales bacterium]
MTRFNLRDRINQGPFLLDGGMGTQLIARGVELGRCNDYLNIESPDIILEVQSNYIQSGSDAVITNTFGANQYALGRHGLSDRVTEINKAAVEIARKAAGRDKYVLGDMGPSGDFLEPLGMIKPAELKEAFTVQAQALLDGGVDGFIIETMTALDELEIAVQAAASVAGGRPVMASMSFDKAGDDFKTMMGVSAIQAIDKMASLGLFAVGFNCGTVSLEEYIILARQFVDTVHKHSDNLLIYAEPNAGKPELVDGQAVYRVSPDEFAEAVEKIYSLGVKIIGGCCGTTPAHIKAIADKLKK